MSALLDKLAKSNTSNKMAGVLANSISFVSKDTTPTELPVLNIAFSGDIDGGLVSGVSVFAGESKCYKTLLALYCMKAYFDKHPDAIALFYDSEFGVTSEYLQANGIDANRVLHIPITNIEELKFDMVQRLEQIERGDKVFIMVDSLGLLPSKKEAQDAADQKSVADMTRAKEIRSFFRVVTPHMTLKDIPCVVINHVYKTMELYAKTIISGGTAVMFSANQAFIISRSQEKDASGTLEGWNFTILVEKSRFVREKSKLTFQVLYGSGVATWSGLMDLALASGHIENPTRGWYQKKGDDKKFRMAETETAEFWDSILQDETFKQYVVNTYSLKQPLISGGDISDDGTE